VTVFRMGDNNLQRAIQHERHEEIVRALEFKDTDPKRAAYHTGLADGCNSILTQLGHLTREYPADDRRATEVPA
jgi:hypothetical protein